MNLNHNINGASGQPRWSLVVVLAITLAAETLGEFVLDAMRRKPIDYVSCDTFCDDRWLLVPNRGRRRMTVWPKQLVQFLAWSGIAGAIVLTLATGLDPMFLVEEVALLVALLIGIAVGESSADTAETDKPKKPIEMQVWVLRGIGKVAIDRVDHLSGYSPLVYWVPLDDPDRDASGTTLDTFLAQGTLIETPVQAPVIGNDGALSIVDGGKTQ